MEQRLNEVDYITLENVDPANTKEEVHALLLQAIEGTQSAGYHLLSPLSMPILTTPPPTQPDTFSNWKADLFIPDALVHLSLEQLLEVIVAEGLE